MLEGRDLVRVGYAHSFQWKGCIALGVREDVFALAEPVVESQGLKLVDVEYAKEGPRWFVRLFLYRPEGVNLEDCQRVSDAVGTALEARDVIKNPYHLEVSSPGAERVLKSEREFHIFQGHLAKLTLREPVEGQQVLYGRLGPITAETVTIAEPAGPRAIARDNVKQIRLALESSVPAK